MAGNEVYNRQIGPRPSQHLVVYQVCKMHDIVCFGNESAMQRSHEGALTRSGHMMFAVYTLIFFAFGWCELAKTWSVLRARL